MISNPPKRPDTESVTIKITQEVAETKGVDPTEVSPPLYDTVDTEALDTLIQSSKDGPDGCEVSFEYNGCMVRIETDGTVKVDDDTQDVSC